MILRAAIPDDVESAVAVWKAADAARRGSPSATPGGEKRLRSYIAKPDSFLLVAEDFGELIGMALGMQGLADDGAGPPIEGLCHVSAVFVSPERWGEGIGKKLVVAIISEAHSRHFVRAQLWTHADNVRAQRLYEGFGFRRSGRTNVDDQGEEIVHYEREI